MNVIFIVCYSCEYGLYDVLKCKTGIVENFFFLAFRKEKVDLQKLVKWSHGLVLEVIIETKVVQNISHRGRGFSQGHHFKAYQEFL